MHFVFSKLKKDYAVIVNFSFHSLAFALKILTLRVFSKITIMAITYQTEGVKLPPIKRRLVSSWIKSVAALHHKKVGEIAYVFCDDERILQINNEYLQHDYYTDIITFDYTVKDVISGDIFISLDTVKSNSVEINTLYETEIHRIIIHGVLHLCGINDKTPEEREVMTQNEDEALRLLETL